MRAVVLAAGAGRKFWPYNEVRNKCAFPIAGEPVIRRLVEQLAASGVVEVLVVLGARGGSVRAALAGLEDRIAFVRQPAGEEHQGTGAALSAVLDAHPSLADSPFVAACADVVTTAETVRALVQAAREGGAPAAAVACPLAHEPAGAWITAHERNGALHGFSGHGRGGSLRVGGLYAFQPGAVPALRANPGIMTHVPVGGMPPLEDELAESLARMVDSGHEVAVIAASGFLVDLDKPWHILEATARVLEERAAQAGESRIAAGARVSEAAEIEPGARLFLEAGAEIGRRVVVRGDLWLGRSASVTNGAVMNGRCVLGAGARVRDYALVGGGTTLGPGSLCGHGAEFEGVLLDGAYLYHYCEVDGVVGSKVDIGAATVCGTLRFDDQATIHRHGGKAEQPAWGANASYLGDYSRTGVNAVLMPGVKVGAYSCVGPGVVLYEDLPSREMVLVKQELVRRPWGPERYGW